VISAIVFVFIPFQLWVLFNPHVGYGLMLAERQGYELMFVVRWSYRWRTWVFSNVRVRAKR
jgi:hypothetical protein